MSSPDTNDDKKLLPFILDIVKVKEVNLGNVKVDEVTPYEFQMKQYLSSHNADIKLIKELRQKAEGWVNPTY